MFWFKCVFYFTAPGGGWSEVWYLQKSQIRAAVEPCKNLARLRAGLLGKFALIKVVRISSVDAPRSSIREVLRVPGSAYETGLADAQWTGILAIYNDVDAKYQTSRILRGVPDDWVKRDSATGDFDLEQNGILTSAHNRFIQSLRQNMFAFRDRSAEGADGTTTDVTNWGVDVAGFIRLEPVGSLTLTSKVTFAGITGAGSELMKGTHSVKSIEGGIVTLSTKAPAGVNVATWTGGKSRRKVTGTFTVYEGQVDRPSSRDTGRPFGQRRGRQPKQRKPLSTPAAG